jgi:hypothetical protein
MSMSALADSTIGGYRPGAKLLRRGVVAVSFGTWALVYDRRKARVSEAEDTPPGM